MSCGTCVRWRRREEPGRPPRPDWALPWSRYGNCRWPGVGPRPYWMTRPEAVVMTPDCHGNGCPAYREKKAR